MCYSKTLSKPNTGSMCKPNLCTIFCVFLKPIFYIVDMSTMCCRHVVCNPLIYCVCSSRQVDPYYRLIDHLVDNTFYIKGARCALCVTLCLDLEEITSIHL